MSEWTPHRDGEVLTRRFAFLDYAEVEIHGDTDFTATAHRDRKHARERRQDWTLEQAKARAVELYEELGTAPAIR